MYIYIHICLHINTLQWLYNGSTTTLHRLYTWIFRKCRYIHIFIHTVKQTLYSATGWRRLIGSPKLQIILHKRATKCRALLRKMTYKDKGSYESSPPSTVSIKKDVSQKKYVSISKDSTMTSQRLYNDYTLEYSTDFV